ncbi:MAG: lipopolysaccharide biosynthesis protein, partial [Gammaproteobacteria bacterium]
MLSNAAKKRSDKVHASPQLTRFERKLRKLKNNPSAFFKDSFVVKKTGKGLQFTYAKLGMYFLVLVISLGVISYYAFVASSRYTSQSQFVVKQAGGGELQLSGLAALGSVSPSLKDSLVLKRFIESREMAVALDESIGLKAH